MVAKAACDEVRGECLERMDALEQRLESVEGMRSLLDQVGRDVSYMRGRFDQMVATPPPATPRRHRLKPLAINIGTGGLGAALFAFLERIIR